MMSASSSLEQQLEALKKTHAALANIQNHIQPYLNKYDLSADCLSLTVDECAEMDVAVSMTIGTLRYMAARMKGCHVKSSDPLRMELDKMRTILKNVRKAAKGKNNVSSSSISGSGSYNVINNTSKESSDKEEMKPDAFYQPVRMNDEEINLQSKASSAQKRDRNSSNRLQNIKAKTKRSKRKSI